MRLRILTPVLAFSILLISCTEEKPASVMPVTTDSELALEFYETGQLAYDQLKTSEAWHSFEAAVKEDPNFFMAHFWMFFMSSKDFKKVADKAFKADIELNPGEEQLRSVLKYLTDGQDEKVVEQLKDLINMYPSDPHIHKILYLIQFHYYKDIEAALVTMERTVKECPDYPHVYNLLGYAYMDLEQWDEAEKTFDKYIQLSPNTANPYDSKGDYFLNTEQYEKAYESYKKAVEIDPSFSGISKKKAKKAKMMFEKTNS